MRKKASQLNTFLMHRALHLIRIRECVLRLCLISQLRSANNRDIDNKTSIHHVREQEMAKVKQTRHHDRAGQGRAVGGHVPDGHAAARAAGGGGSEEAKLLRVASHYLGSVHGH